jgi:hypothetical protein
VDLTVISLAFDVEILLRARQAGLSIYELPVSWSEAPGSRVRPVRDSLSMLKELWSLSRLPKYRVHRPDILETIGGKL